MRANTLSPCCGLGVRDLAVTLTTFAFSLRANLVVMPWVWTPHCPGPEQPAPEGKTRMSPALEAEHFLLRLRPTARL